MSDDRYEVHVSQGGIELVWGEQSLRQRTADLTGDLVEVSLGSTREAGTWRTADEIEVGPINTVRAAFAVTPAVTPGVYYLWLRIHHGGQVVTRRMKNKPIWVT